MKNLNKILLAVVVCFTVMSCTKDDIQSTDREAVVPVNAPVLLNPSATFNMVLQKANETSLATSVVWNDATYNGTTTVVNYAIEIAKAGTNFKTPVTLATTTNRFKDITVGELNTAFLNAGLNPFTEQQADIRVKSYVGSVGSGVSQVSNSFTIKATPYPSWPNWGMIGSATAATTGGDGWANDVNLEYDLTTKKYSITINLAVGEIKFRLDDAWATNYGGSNGILIENGSNIPITVAGNYTIVADFNAKTYSITKN